MNNPILQYDEVSGNVVPLGSHLGATLRDPETMRLQNALNALAKAKNNPALKVVADGVLGPKTAASLSMAIKTYAPGYSKVPLPLQVTQVKTQQTQFANIVEAYLKTLSVKPVVPAQAPRLSPKPPVIDKSAIKRLQTAIKQMWPLVNDRALDITIDGAVGPKTQAAANLVFAKYLPNKLPLPMSVPQIQGGANTFAVYIEEANKRLKENAQKAVAKQLTVDAAKQKGSPGNAALIDKQSVTAMQKYLVALGNALKVNALKIKVDGALGPKTVAAANLALSKYISGVTAAFKTGKLTQSQIATMPVVIAQLIDAELKRLSAKSPALTTADSQKKAVAAQAAANSLKTNHPTKAALIDKSNINALQQSINALGKVVSDKALKVAVDGKLGPKTAAAVNVALKKYCRAATPQMMKGLSVAQVGESSAALTSMFKDESAARQADKQRITSAGNAAKERLSTNATENIERTVQNAANGDDSATKELATLAVAENSHDPEIASKASDAMDVARQTAVDIGEAEITSVGPQAESSDEIASDEVSSYLDERTIDMPLDTIEDQAELGGNLALQSELGFSIKSIGKGITKGVKSVGKGALTVAKTAAAPALMLLKLNALILTKIAIPIASVMCSLPKPVVHAACVSANVNPNHVFMFCAAIRLKRMADVKRLLPQALKVAVKLSVTGAAPGIAPILRTITLIPKPIRKLIPGLSMLAGWQDDIVGKSLNNCGCY